MRKRTRSHCFPKPFTAQERLQLLNELEYYEQQGRFSPTSSERVRARARRMRWVFPDRGPTYEEKKQRLREAILRDMVREAEDDRKARG